MFESDSGCDFEGAFFSASSSLYCKEIFLILILILSIKEKGRSFLPPLFSVTPPRARPNPNPHALRDGDGLVVVAAGELPS